jgi:peptidyl-prolyl cis-trans isomerase B (cyclophilin B)
MGRSPLAVLLLLLALVAAGCGGDDEEPETRTATRPAAEATAEGGCERVAAARAKDAEVKKPSGRLSARKTTVAVVDTSCGSFEITLDAKRAPKTGFSFAHLAREGFYDGLGFHRIVPGFVIQGGDPQGNGQGGPGYSITEAPPKNLAYGKGVVAMAKTPTEAPGTSGSQFFVVTAEDTPLEPEYALVGKVTKGQEVVDRIGVLATDQSTEQPLEPVVIRSVKIEER